jgi:3'(2'), 5'-bisphosphate nucleotidase
LVSYESTFLANNAVAAMDSSFPKEYLASCCEIAKHAGECIMRHFLTNVAVQHKVDHSPVTVADIEANHLITEALLQLSPEIPVIAEEDTILNPGGHALFWLVDPLDGTRAFVKGEPEFTVNIGLIENGLPILGVIYAPAQQLLYFAGKGSGAFRGEQKINVRTPSPEGLVVVKSKSHPSAATQAYLDTIKIKEMIPGSSSIKFCQVAEGSADIYPRFGRTMEWDTAAGHAILNEAGGRMETADGKAFLYGKPGFENPAFIAFGSQR